MRSTCDGMPATEILRRRARAAWRSLSEFVLRELRRTAERPTIEEVFERAERRTGRFSFHDVVGIVAEDRAERPGGGA